MAAPALNRVDLIGSLDDVVVGHADEGSNESRDGSEYVEQAMADGRSLELRRVSVWA